MRTLRRLRRADRPRALGTPHTTCVGCRAGDCSRCVDVPRSAYTDQMLCTCRRAEHPAALPPNPPTWRYLKEPT